MLRNSIAVLAVWWMFALGALRAPAQSDWPMFLGDGDRTPPQTGRLLVDHLEDAPILWELKRHMGVGKGLYPGHLKLSREHGIEPFYGGAASPIVAGGTVFVAYFKADGQVPAAIEPWRTVSDPQQYLPPWFFSVTADDILIAVDAETGRLRWEQIERGKGLNRLGHKRGHWCVAPVWAEGRVFRMGTAGRLYAYEASTGEKRWEVVAEPELQQLREKYLQSKQMCWEAREKSSLVVAAGAVVVPHEGLTAFETATGQQRWSIAQRVLSPHATPSLWRHGGREYLAVNDGQGTLRLIDPHDGRVLWTYGGLGEQIGSLDVTGDLLVLNARSTAATDTKRNGLFGLYRLSRDGLQLLWTLPDSLEYRHSWTLDRGAERRAAIQDGRVYLVVGDQADRLVTADLRSGQILDEQLVDHAHAPYPMEDRLLVYHDRAHTDPVVASWWSIEGGRPRQLHGAVGFGPRTITGYEVPIQWPYVDGRLYARTLDGLACFDLRRPAEGPENRTLRTTIPARVAGSGQDLQVTLTQRGGRLTHGGFAGSPRLHAVDTTQAKWDGRRLSGMLRIDVDGYRRFDEFEVDAALGDDGHLSGTITSRAEPFEKPVPRRGTISAIPHQPNWMPPCTHVLQLPAAGIQQGGLEGRLLLFVTIQAGTLRQVAAFADQTTQARPVLDASCLKYAGNRLSGIIRVRYRADQWAQPLAERGETAAAEYEIDARLSESGDVGAYTGVFGVAWLRSAPLGP